MLLVAVPYAHVLSAPVVMRPPRAADPSVLLALNVHATAHVFATNVSIHAWARVEMEHYVASSITHPYALVHHRQQEILSSNAAQKNQHKQRTIRAILILVAHVGRAAMALAHTQNV